MRDRLEGPLGEVQHQAMWALGGWVERCLRGRSWGAGLQRGLFFFFLQVSNYIYLEFSSGGLKLLTAGACTPWCLFLFLTSCLALE